MTSVRAPSTFAQLMSSCSTQLQGSSRPFSHTLKQLYMHLVGGTYAYKQIHLARWQLTALQM
jgi:hypothetical protein